MIISTKTKMQRILFILFFFLPGGWQAVEAQVNQCPSCWQPIYRQRMVWNQNISANINGYVEFLPNGYDPYGTKKYPLIINFHGRDKQGPGNSQESVCAAACEGLALKLEQYRFPETVVVNGVSYSFIILTPQYLGGSGGDFAPMIDYAISRYKVDPDRVYLTGLSLGASYIMDFMSSSSNNAKKVAAIVPLAGCNSSNPAGASNTATQKVHYWGIHCLYDQTCPSTNTVSWANGINSYSPGNPMATADLTPVYNPGFYHDIFSTVYDINWKDLPDNVFHQHITEWMVQYSRSSGSALPAILGNYQVKLKDKQVLVDWTTTLESLTDYFTIERAGPDMQFRQIGKISASGNSSNPISYSFTDPLPLKGTSFYRVVLINKDGLPDIFEIKKITNREFGVNFSLSPVPAGKILQLSFETDESQKLNFSIRDINGRTLRAWSANFTSGSANLGINIEALSPGIYYLNVQGNRFTEAKKFVKQ